MSTSEKTTGARTMWELVDRRGPRVTGSPMLIAAHGETVTFGQFRDRAGSGWPPPCTAWV